MVRPGKPSPEPSNSLTALVWPVRMERRFSAATKIFSVGIINVCVSTAMATGLTYERSARNSRARSARRPASGNQCLQYPAVTFRREQSALRDGDRGIDGEQGLD